MNPKIMVIGVGRLADLVCDLWSLSSVSYRLVRQPNLESVFLESADLSLVLSDGWDPGLLQAAEERFQSSGKPWLRAHVWMGEGVVGPLVLPGTAGCSRCADTRSFMAGNDRPSTWDLQQHLTEQGGIASDAWGSRTAMLQLAHYLVEEAQSFLQGNPVRTEARMMLMNLNTLGSSLHRVLPDPQCTLCSRLPEDTADNARIELQPSPKINPDRYRCRPMEELKQVLARDYLDLRTGLLNGKMMDLVAPFADSSVNLPLFGADEGCAGRTNSYADSELTAILEGLERYCGMSPRGKRTMVYGSYRELEDQALDPRSVGVHDRQQYEKPDFPLQPFDPDRQVNWVWGYSFLEERPILVPEQLAYYNSGCGQGFVYETSNGCALGGTLEEAIFYGILEVVERDSFLMTWYAKLPLPRLDPYSADDRELELMMERLRAVAGYDVYLFDSTMEHGIPSVWTIAKNRNQRGVNVICAAGAHPDPIRAVKGSIHEIGGMLMAFNEKLEANRSTYLEMLNDPYQVRQMEDHSMLYSLPEAEERFEFLMAGDRPLRTFKDQYRPRARHADLTDDLKHLLRTFRSLSMDVIVVDQTTPEMERNGLSCVKVLIPGMLPMTFGYHMTRLVGLDRVLKVPAKLGYADAPLRPEQLNAHPHPFP